MMIKLGIRGKIYCGLISIVLLTGLMIAVPVRIMVERALSQESLKKGMSMALTLAARSQDFILGMDFLYLREMMDKAIQSSNDVSYSFILDRQGQVLSHTFHDGFPVELRTVNDIPDGQPSSVRFLDTGKELIYDIAVPVLIGDMRLGAVHIGLSKTRINHTIKGLLWTMALLIGCAVLIASLTGAGFANQIIQRVQKLHQASEQVLKGNLNVFAAPPLKIACWHLMDCRNESCPAYGEDRRRCWNIEGTLCPSCLEGQIIAKSDVCKTCRIYRTVSGDEIQALAESFDAMTRSLKHTISERRNMELQLLQADKLSSLGQLSAGVAHEINNPLGLILGYTQLMLREEPESSQKYEDLKTIEKHTRNCKTIVEALLNFARKTETKKILVDVNSAIAQVITVIRHQFELSGIGVHTLYDSELPQVLGDTEKLKQVVMNLVMNARQAMTTTGKITVSTRYDSKNHKVMVMVADTGSGIPPHVVTRIFDPFFTTKPTGQGTGLGLSVSYGIVKEHGGEITVYSEPDNGSQFSMILPAADDVS
jgi:signal transduction histidine kinase